MSNALPQRPIGFAPEEISALVNQPVVARHAEEAAFLWTQRARAVSAPHYTLKDLAALDERVDAQVDGLREAGAVGWALCQGNLAISQGPGEIFALSAAAFSSGERPWMSEALAKATLSAAAQPGLVSALGWLDYGTVSPWIARLLGATASLHRSIGIRASAIHRRDPGPALAAAVADGDAVLRASGLRAVGQLKRRDLLNQARSLLGAEDEATRFWAAWSLALNGDNRGCQVLTAWFDRHDDFSDRALQLALRALPLAQSRQWISYFASQQPLAAVVGAGVVGDPASIPWLIRQLSTPALARLAGESISMITGVDLEYEDLTGDPPLPLDEEASIEEVEDLGYETYLPWPSPSGVERWWQEQAAQFSPGARYLAGQPITPGSCLEVLRQGRQRHRASAALELALLRPEQPLFEVRSRGDRQFRDVALWNS